MQFRKNVSLKNYTTFKIGGRAKYFFVARTKLNLIKAMQEAKKLGLPFFVLGGGSNVLISDKEYEGLVIQVKNQKVKIKNDCIFIEVGMTLARLVRLASKNNLTGLEWAAGIPGTVGGAIYGNAGAFSKSMKNIVKQVEIFDIKKNKIRKLTNKNCQFGYRSSVFKRKPHLIILSCEIKLQKGDRQEIKKEMQEYLDYRAAFHPRDPSAGSIFTNPKGFSARELIDVCGLKGKKINGAQISKVHSNFIINCNGASSQSVLKLIDLIKKEVKKKFKIKLKEEIIKLN